MHREVAQRPRQRRVGTPALGGRYVTCTTRTCGLAGTPAQLRGSLLLGSRREALSLPPAAKGGGWGSEGGRGSCGVPLQAALVVTSRSCHTHFPWAPAPASLSIPRLWSLPEAQAGTAVCRRVAPPPGCERERASHAERGRARRDRHDGMCSRLRGKCHTTEKWPVPAGRMPVTERTG